MTNANDAWVSPGVAYQVIGDEFAKRLACSPLEGRDHAADELLFELQEGRIRARARDCRFDLNDGVELRRLRCMKEPLPTWEDFAPKWVSQCGNPGPRRYAGPAELPREFWEYCENHIWPQDWAVGNFTWNDHRYPLQGHARGVEFAVSGLPFEDVVRDVIERPASPSEPGGGTLANRRAGRPAGAGPAKFTAALETYLRENPGAGEGKGAISRIANAVLGGFEIEPVSDGYARKIVRMRLAGLAENPPG